jgi:hypothetical protein
LELTPLSQQPVEYVAARRVLLDALEALRDHLEHVILVGAQAVYLHTGSGSLSTPAMTTDADVALDIAGLGRSPEISGLLRGAGFRPGTNPGHWLGAGDVAVDVMVVPHQGNPPRPDSRAARIPPHSKESARIAPGLEAALVDRAPRTITALEATDPRTVEVNLAGPAALLVAKLIKISERFSSAERGRADRLREKDALDILRILQQVEIDSLVSGFARHQAEPHAASSSAVAVQFLREHGLEPGGQLPRLAVAAALGDPTTAVIFAALAVELTDALDGGPSRTV